MESTLVLNASYEPLNISPASKAINKILNGKAVAVDNSDKIWRGANHELYIPYVIQLTYMVKRKRNQRIGFSRRGVLARDNFTCAYCGAYADTIDHVIPRSIGGANSYENCVASCFKCNCKKSDSSLEKMGWSLKFEPYSPSPYSIFLQKAGNSAKADIWSQYVTPWEHVKA